MLMRIGHPGLLGLRGELNILLAEEKEVGSAVCLGFLGYDSNATASSLGMLARTRAEMSEGDHNTK